MSIRWMVEVWERAPLTGSRLLCLLAMADYANDEGLHIYPSMRTLAGKCRLSEKQMRRVVHGLVEDGYLEVIQTGGFVKGKNRSNEYAIKPIWRDDRPPADGSIDLPPMGVIDLPPMGEDPSFEPSRNPPVNDDDPFADVEDPCPVARGEGPKGLDLVFAAAIRRDWRTWSEKNKVLRGASDTAKRASWLLFQTSGLEPSGSRAAWLAQIETLWGASSGDEGVYVGGIRAGVEARDRGGLTLSRPSSFLSFVRSERAVRLTSGSGSGHVGSRTVAGVELVELPPWRSLSELIRRFGYGSPLALPGHGTAICLDIPHGRPVSWDLYVENSEVMSNSGMVRRASIDNDAGRDGMVTYLETLEEAIGNWMKGRGKDA